MKLIVAFCCHWLGASPDSPSGRRTDGQPIKVCSRRRVAAEPRASSVCKGRGGEGRGGKGRGGEGRGGKGRGGVGKEGRGGEGRGRRQIKSCSQLSL